MANGHGGRRPGAGRKHGSASRKTREIADRAAAESITPLEVMLHVMRLHYDAGRLDDAAAVAKDAAPYVHPRLSSMQVSGGETPVKLQLVEEIVLGINTNGNGDHHPNGEAAPSAAGVPHQ